ncbi:MAG: hypothetical protein RPR40_03750 [Bermanella sp.]
MIDSIHARLLYWAEVVNGAIDAGYASSSMEGLITGSSGHGGGSSVLLSVEADETGRAVAQLSEALVCIVREFYLNDSSTLEQKLKALAMSKRTLYRRLDESHGLLKGILRTLAA